MKGLTKTILIAVLAIAFISIFPQKIPSQGPFLYCVVHFCMENKDRHFYQKDLHAECGYNWPHDPPFGNWGVRSNISDKQNGHQFQGWEPIWKWPFGKQLQWNSCTDTSPWKPPSECGEWYNDKRIGDLCYEQHSSNEYDRWGIWKEHNNYAGGVNYMEIPREFQDDG